MKKTNRFLSIILTILMVISIIPITANAATYSGACGDNLTWNFDVTTGTLTISGTGDMYDYSYDYQPWMECRGEIKKIVVNVGATSIGNFSFCNFDSLESLTISDSVTSIGVDAFASCDNLGSVKIPEGVTIIDLYAFCNCTSLEEITIPDSVITVGSVAFYGCTSLTDVYYSGDEDNWNKISIGDYNDPLLNATIHYNSTGPHTHSHKSAVTPPTCTEEGYLTYTCECGDSYVDDYVDALGHTEEILSPLAPTCTETGLTEGTKCSVCNETLTEQEIVPATDHADNDGDGYCDMDNKLLDPSVECDHNCHKGGVSGFFWKIINFFNKLFGLNKTCQCGVAHY